MEMTAYEPGVPSWVDLGSPDPQGAADFYGALFGWECARGPAGDRRLPRRAWSATSAVAGIGPAQNPGPPVWATLRRTSRAPTTPPPTVTAAGGQVIVPPMDVLDVGRMAVFTDPVGAVFSVWQAGHAPGRASS